MPRPLMILFLFTATAAVGLILVLMIKPPRPTSLPLGERRSPPRGPLTHDVGRIVAAPVPSPHAPEAAACPAFARTVVEAGSAGYRRIASALGSLCGLTGASITPELQKAVEGLGTVTIRYAGFVRTGEEAATDLSAGVLYLNVRFARSNSPTILAAPILVHEGWHLANRGERITAAQEYRARVAELDACKQLIDRDKWIRNCDDAARIVGLGEARAISLLVAAGFPRS